LELRVEPLLQGGGERQAVLLADAPPLVGDKPADRGLYGIEFGDAQDRFCLQG
jgi:hypothetical protein